MLIDIILAWKKGIFAYYDINFLNYSRLSSLLFRRGEGNIILAGRTGRVIKLKIVWAGKSWENHMKINQSWDTSLPCWKIKLIKALLQSLDC